MCKYIIDRHYHTLLKTDVKLLKGDLISPRDGRRKIVRESSWDIGEKRKKWMEFLENRKRQGNNRRNGEFASLLPPNSARMQRKDAKREAETARRSQIRSRFMDNCIFSLFFAFACLLLFLLPFPVLLLLLLNSLLSVANMYWFLLPRPVLLLLLH